MKYEMKQTAIDPFDIMCGECVEHEIEWWEETTEQELREKHEMNKLADAWVSEAEKRDLIEDGLWYPTPEKFEDWIEDAIKSGYIRKVA